MAGVLGPQSVRTGRSLADVFADSDSEHERTFYGFSDDEISDPWCQTADVEDEDEAQPGLPSREQKATSKPSLGVHTFRLRVALRTTSTTQQSADEEEAVGDEERRNERRETKAGKSGRKKKLRVKFEDEEITVTRPPSSEGPGSDSAEDEAESFLDKRQKNIKANKAMLAQLMADLEKMPGGAVLLKKQAGKQKTKEKKSRPPRSESRKNPERASRRQTRSMGGVEDTSVVKEEELEFSLEEELLGVRRAPQRRGAPRPNQCKPHVIRPVEDITEDEIQLVADNMTDKVYNRVTGSTCHQCRQKTIDTKTCCRSEDCRGIQGQFCGPCLRNRYGEDVKKALVDPEWKCPPCRGICNCSFCRQRDGRCPTGILFPLAQYHGFSDVHSYLTSLRNKLKNDDTDVEL